MYFSSSSDQQQEQVSCPDETAGLYIQSRSGEIVHMSIPTTACGFQIGETSQIQSGGLLRATPHAVRSASGVTRESFALFLEPEFETPLNLPPGKSTLEDDGTMPPTVVPLHARWKPGQTFGDFHVATVSAFTTT
jgi:isopenicillin N synthase-like dioxygenase